MKARITALNYIVYSTEDYFFMFLLLSNKRPKEITGWMQSSFLQLTAFKTKCELSEKLDIWLYELLPWTDCCDNPAG